MTIIYAHKLTPRLSYVATTIFGKNVAITSNLTKFEASPLQKINYSQNCIAHQNLWIVPCGLLEEKNITPQKINCFEWNGLKAFFKTNGSLPFDVFAAAFYLLTRYEEYLPNASKDKHQNYSHTNSIAFKENFLHLPLIELWLKKIEVVYSIKIMESSFNFIPTFDIDMAYAYKHHSAIKQVGGIAKHAIRLNKEAIERTKAAIDKNYTDPFDVFDWLNNLHQENNIKPIYFFLLANERSKFDKNVPVSSMAYQQLIKKICSKNEFGIHPSYSSNKNTAVLNHEIKTLENIVEQVVTNSRQHYLKLALPLTYRNLINQKITTDYTMGYSACNGFRASYSKSFFWYDLENEQTTNLLIRPFCYMDASSIFNLKHHPTQALNQLLEFFEALNFVNGTMIIVLHNHFLADNAEYKDWRNVYEKFLLHFTQSSKK